MWGVGQKGDGSLKYKSLSYAVNKSWGYNIQHGDYS